MQVKEVYIKREITEATKTAAIKDHIGATTLIYSAPNGKTYLIDSLFNPIGLKTFAVNCATVVATPIDSMLS